MHPAAVVLAQASQPQGFSTDTLVHLGLVALVTVALLGLAGLVVAFFNRRMSVQIPEPSAAPTTKPVQPMPATPQPAAQESIPPEIVAVIAAAVASSMSRPVRIVSIKRQHNYWEIAGRQAVLSSHRIRR